MCWAKAVFFEKQAHSEQNVRLQPRHPKNRDHQPNMKLNHLDVGEFVIKNNISTTTQLYAAANWRKTDGENDLALYIMEKGKLRVMETIMKAWDRIKDTSCNLAGSC